MNKEKRALVKKGVDLFAYRDGTTHTIIKVAMRGGSKMVQLRRAGSLKTRWALMDTVINGYGIA